LSDAVMQATIKAFDEFSEQFRKLQTELHKIEKAQKDTSKGTDQMNKSVSTFLQTIGSLGALYAFKRGLEEVMATGREFELTIKQAQAVTGDFSSTLRDMAMATRGGTLDVFGPTQLAEAYRELGAAGAGMNDIMAATPDILEFGTAAMLGTEQAAYGVLAAAKSFNIELSDSQQIVDAYTESMNLGALAGEDFQWIMSSAGAVAKMAGQDFREILSVGSAMRDAGIQAQDAGTAIKSALMHLMDPAKEAQDIMKELGINIYDASGNMKQWSEITKEFETALSGANAQTQQMVLSTVFGTDGIRAMATSINKGSDYLATFTEGLKNADGATHEMAEAMADTFDGAVRKANSSLEKTKILLFEDISRGAVTALDAINTLLIGFISLDDATRQLIELIVGAGGLVVALAAVTRALQALGVTAATLTGPVGILTMAIGVLTTGVIAYKGAQEQARIEAANHIETVEGQINRIPQLVQKYEELVGKAERTKTEEEQLKKVTDDLTKIMPDAVEGFDNFGSAILRTGDLAEIAKGKLSGLKAEVEDYYRRQADIAKQELPELKKQENEARKKYEELYKTYQQMKAGIYESKNWPTRKIGKWEIPLEWTWENPDAVWAQVKEQNDLINTLKSQRLEYEKSLDIYKNIQSGDYWNKKEPHDEDEQKLPGAGGTGIGSGYQEGKAKSAIDAITYALEPYRYAVEETANALDLLGAKEQYIAEVMDSKQATVYEAIELNRVCSQQYDLLTQQQDRLHEQAEAERIAMEVLREKLVAASDPEVVADLENEIVSLTGSINEASIAWWDAERDKLRLLNQVKAEEKKRYDQAYQQAMDLMNHQINMARMSTEQQITYLKKLRDSYNWTTQQMWDIEESLFRLRRQQLSDYLGVMEDAYEDQLEAIDSKTQSLTQEIQAQIDALDDDSTTANREEALYQHNQKLKELQEERQYHELRTGKEHQKAIKSIDEEIAEEERQFKLQQEEWSREDKQKALEQQLEDVQDAGAEERRELEEHYREARDIAEDGMMDIIAALAATGPEWMQTGKDLINQLIEGLDSGDFSSVQSQITNIRKQASSTTITEPDVPTPTSGDEENESLIAAISPDQIMNIGGTYYMWSRELASILGKSVDWNQETGQVKIGSNWFTPGLNKDGKAYVGIREVAEALGFDVEYVGETDSINIYRQYALGGYVPETGPAYLHEGEYVLPANLVEAIRMMAPPPAHLSGKTGGGTIIHNEQYFHAPLIGIDNQYINEDVDSTILATETAGLVKSVRRGGG